MNIALSWLESYVDLDRPISEVAHILTMAGIEVEEIRQVGADWDQCLRGPNYFVGQAPERGQTSARHGRLRRRSDHGRHRGAQPGNRRRRTACPCGRHVTRPILRLATNYESEAGQAPRRALRRYGLLGQGARVGRRSLRHIEAR